MLSKAKIKELVDYWIKTSEHSFKTMESLFRSRRYADSLFYGHIVLEKILKALVVLNTSKQAKYTHNLLVLAKDANLLLSDKERKLLVAVDNFNIRSRYPDVKFAFYKTSTRDYTEKNLKEIKQYYKILCRKIRLD